MGRRGPKPVAPETLYAFAHQFYWDFHSLARGTYRFFMDKKKYAHGVELAEKIQLSDDQKSRIRRLVEDEIREGRLKEADREIRQRDVEEGELAGIREGKRIHAAQEAQKYVMVPGEPDVLKALLRAKTPERVRGICQGAFRDLMVEVAPGVKKSIKVRNWPISPGSVLPMYLSQYASEFVAAKKHRRFPRSTRPSNQLKQLWFLSRAVAGALFELKTRTAINLVGSKRPEQIFEESRAAKPERKRRREK
jgi:hypothetical protein